MELKIILIIIIVAIISNVCGFFTGIAWRNASKEKPKSFNKKDK